LKLTILVCTLLIAISLHGQDSLKLIPYRAQNILAVIEDKDGKYLSYYVLKNGKVVARDSVFFFDNAPDCESEGFIRFRDYANDKVGMLDSNGRVVIPAAYDFLSMVRNGMVVALRGATKVNADTEHPGWSGGQNLLIDTNDRILAENFDNDRGVNFYSVQKSPLQSADKTRRSFLATDGQYYSFIIYDVEFQQWITTNLRLQLSKEKLLKASVEQITSWDEGDGWISEPKEIFVKRNFEAIRSRLREVGSPKGKYHVSTDGLNPYTYDSPKYGMYFNSCREPKEWQYPVLDLVIDHQENGESVQDHFGFLRTDEGYKLIEVTLR